MTEDKSKSSMRADFPAGWGGLLGGWAYSPDGSALGLPHGSCVSILDATTWAESVRLVGHGDRVRFVAFSADGGRIASASADGTVRVWNVSDGAPLATLSTEVGPATAMAFSPDGKSLLAVCGPKDKRALLRWTVPQGEQGAAHAQPTGSAAAISPDGKLVALSGESAVFGSVSIVDGAAGTVLREIEVQGRANLLAFDASSSRLAGEAHNRYYVWDPTSGAVSLDFECEEVSSASVAFSPDGGALALGSAVDGECRVVDVAMGQVRMGFKCASDDVRTVAFRPGASTIAVGETALEEFDTGSGKLTRALAGSVQRSYAIDAAPDGSSIALGLAAGLGQEGLLYLCDTSGRVRRLTGHPRLVTAVAFSPDGRTLATGCADKSIRLWDVAAGTITKELKGHKASVRGIRFSADGKTLTSVGTEGDETVRTWDVATGEKKGSKKVGAVACFASALSHDGTLLAVTVDGGVDLFDAASGKKKQSVPAPGLIRGIAFGRDGGAMAWVVDGEATVWSIAEGRKLASFPLPRLEVTNRYFEPPIEQGRAVAFVAGGQALAFGGYDGSVSFYAIPAGTPVAALHVSAEAGWGLVLSMAGRVELLGDVERAASLVVARAGAACEPFARHADALREPGLLKRAITGG